MESQQTERVSEAARRRGRGYDALVEERRWAETLLAGEKRLLEMIALGSPRADVLHAICSFVEEAAPECHCGIYPIDWSGPSFRVGAVASLPESYTAPVEGMRVSCDVAPCGVAVAEKTQVIVEDIATDARWSAYREHVLAHGLRSVWSTPVYARDGRVLGTFCVYQRRPARPSPRHRDLIAQVTHIASIAIERAEESAALIRSRALLAEGQRLSGTGTFWCRVATGEFEWSEQCYRIAEVERSTPLTFALIDARVHPEDVAEVTTRLGRACEAADDLEFECRLLLPDHAIRHVHVVARANGSAGATLEYIGAVQDVTERRISEAALGKLRSELAHVSRVTTLGALTASIAHEVNQPLAGIMTNADTCLRMLDTERPNIEGARETARRTIRDSARAADVIARLRAMFVRKEPLAEAVDINAAAREVIALMLSELRRNRVVLRADLAGALPPVSADRVQLQQVILNLLVNASEAMSGVDDRPRELVIRTARGDDDRVCLTVADVGVGFGAQSIDSLFEPFYTTKVSGMGIGLAVSRSIVESHHGRIWATPNDGPGASFSFSIPCAIAVGAIGLGGLGADLLAAMTAAGVA